MPRDSYHIDAGSGSLTAAEAPLAENLLVCVLRLVRHRFHVTNTHVTRMAVGLAAAIKHLHSSGVAVIAARRCDILVNTTSFELKLMPAVGSLIAHAAAVVVEADHDDAIRDFIEFIRSIRPFMNSNTGSRSSNNSNINHHASADTWDFSSEQVSHLLRWEDWDEEVRKHDEVK